MPPGTFSPVVLAERDPEERGVDLAGLRVPSSRDAEDEAACRRDEVVVCRVCHRAYAKYTCPRCHTRYCALACYKAHDARCVESFHGDALGDAMRGLVVDDDEKKKMAALLRAYAPGTDAADGPSARARSSASSGDDEASSSSERGGDDDALGERATGGHDARDAARCALSSANLRKLNRGEALTLADLSPETMRAFERAARTGELSHLVEPHVPWWTRASARDIKLRRDGTSVVAPIVDEPVSSIGGSASPSFSPPEASSSDAPPPPIEDTPLVPLHALLAPGAKRAGPSPALRWHALDVLAAYTLATRAHDGDWRADPLAAARDLVAFSPTLAAAADTTARASGASRTLADGTVASLEAKEKKAAALAASLPTSAAAALAGVAAAAAAAGATRGVPAAAAAAAASGLTHRDVRDVFRGGRGAVVLALCDARRIARAAVAELEDEGEGPRPECGARERKANARFARALSRAERKLFFLACWAAETEPGDGALEHVASWCERAARKQPSGVEVETRPGGGPGPGGGSEGLFGDERARNTIREL